MKEQSWTFAKQGRDFNTTISPPEAKVECLPEAGMFVWFYYFILGGSNINQQLAVLFWGFLVHLTLGCAISSGCAGWVGSTGEVWIKQRQCATRAQVFASTQSRDWATWRQSWTRAGQVLVCSGGNVLLKIYSIACESSPLLAHWSGTFINSKK